MRSWACRLGIMSGVWMYGSIPPALACGGGGVTSASGVVMGAQRIIMSVRAGGTTDMIVQVTVPKTTGDYGVLIPVPSEPTLDPQPVRSTEFDKLDSITTPSLEFSDDSSSGMSCGCGGDDSAAPSRGGVTVSNPVNIGPVVAVSLTGDNADAVGAWLTEHGFLLPSSDAEILARYVSAGSYFIAIRRIQGSVSNGPTSVGIHYTLQGDHRTLSLGFTKMGAPPTMAFTLFIAAPQAIGPSAPFAAITLNDLDATLLRTTGYASSVHAAVSSRGSKAFILEGTTLKTSVELHAPSIAQFMDDGAVITRATTAVSRSQLFDDVVFATPFSGDIPNRRSASLSPFRPRYAAIGFLGIVFVAHALRRGVRQRS
jgi:hypothetical protein